MLLHLLRFLELHDTNNNLETHENLYSPSNMALNSDESGGVFAPILRLPPELRIQIFEHVLCNKLIHIGLRPAMEGEEGGVSHSNASLDFVERYKPMYAVCSDSPHLWDDAYADSQTSDQNDFSWPARHLGCHGVLNDLRWQDYMTRPPLKCECVIKPCKHFFGYRRSLIEQYGQPPEGVRKMHADSKLDFSLLLVSRQFYEEASLLPYSGNTFGFQIPLDMDVFLEEVLLPHQRDAVAQIYSYMGTLSRPTLPSKVPRGLQVIQCYFAFTDYGREQDHSRYPTLARWVGQFEAVQVIIGDDHKRANKGAPGWSGRNEAVFLEELMSKVKSGKGSMVDLALTVLENDKQ